jgi:putative ABC transport system permease protein
MKFFLLIVKNLRRNLLRTTLTSLAIIVLVFMVTLIWTMLFRLGRITEEKSKDFKLIVTEKWQIPSQMPSTHADYLDPDNPKCIFRGQPGLNIEGKDFMTWSFYGGFVDPKNRSWDTLVFMFVMDPRKIQPMMEDLQDIDPALVKKMVETRDGMLMGRKRLERINKKVGETFTVYSMNYKNIDLEFKIVGVLPADRYDEMAICNDTYFNEKLNEYPNSDKNPDKAKKAKHPLDQKRLNLIWIRVKDKETFAKVADLIERGVPNASTGGRLQVFKDPEVKCETASSGVASFLDSFRDLFWFIQWVLVPVILLTMVLILANAISISVRERRAEMAVLKVLGFSPAQVLTLVLGEALLVGALSGLLAATITYCGINYGMGGIPFPIMWMSKADFKIPPDAFAWGLGVGVLVGFFGSIIPAWSARNVKPSQVFAKVA